MHVQPERRAAEGYAAALDSLKKLDPAPQFIITGGDHVMDATSQSKSRAKLQWDLYNKVLSEHTNLPVHPVLGNHDIWGWDDAAASESDVAYGKAMAMDYLHLRPASNSFSASNWHFVLLDSMTRRDKSYFGRIDPGQLEWLRSDLQSARNKHIAIVSHIPILAACVFFDGENIFDKTAWKVPDSWMHGDARQLLDLFAQHSVKLVISGHIHLVDRVEYRNMTFICDGAVSGNWWKGPCQQFPEGYGIFDLHPDGSFQHQYFPYGWTA
jgi:3',5'-cyclic AMP phosphodiesterase CpdA